MKSIDIRSESAVKLLAEFLDMDGDKSVNAEHFAHGQLPRLSCASWLVADSLLPFRGILLHPIALQRPICLRHHRSGKPLHLALIAHLLTSL